MLKFLPRLEGNLNFYNPYGEIGDNSHDTAIHSLFILMHVLQNFSAKKATQLLRRNFDRKPRNIRPSHVWRRLTLLS